MRLKRIIVSLLILAPFLSACTPEEIALWQSLDNQSNSCHEQVDARWPEGSRAWAHRIVNRESGGDPTAQNSRSSAAGCFQLLKIHAFRFERNGFTWADRYNARANTIAALDLYREAGTRPWS